MTYFAEYTVHLNSVLKRNIFLMAVKKKKEVEDFTEVYQLIGRPHQHQKRGYEEQRPQR